MADNCTGNKIRGGITIYGAAGPAQAAAAILNGEFDFNFECVCGTNIVVPVPVSLLKNGLKNLFMSRGPRALLQWLKAGRQAAYSRIAARAAKTLRPKYNVAAAKASDLMGKLGSLYTDRADIKKQLAKVPGLKEKYEAASRGANINFQKFACSSIGNKAQWKDWVSSGATVNIDGNDQWIRCWRAAKAFFDSQKMLGKTLKTAEEWGAKLAKVENKIEELKKKATQAVKERDKLEKALLLTENSNIDVSDIDAMIDSLPPEAQATFLDHFMDGFMWMLEVTSIVQKKYCMSNTAGLPDGIYGAGLNEDTCECSQCSNGKLCDLSSWVRYLPNTPGSRQSDELNVCINCCDDAHPKARWFTGGIIGSVVQEFGVPPCSCECPTEVDGKKTEWVECEAPNACERGTIFSDKRACKTLVPPDGKSLSQSKYKWDADTCAWVCKTPCGSDCCDVDKCCKDGVCETCCPPGYQTKRVPKSTGVFAQEETDPYEYQCVPDCNYPEHACEKESCCEPSLFNGFDLYVCTACPDKSRSFWLMDYD